MKKDICSIKDIQFLVDQFYESVQKDSYIGPVFNARLKGRWEMHHQKLYRFWNSILLHGSNYNGDPVAVHLDLNINQSHFDRWLSVWTRIIDEHFEGKIAEKAKFRGGTMAKVFLAKISKAVNGRPI